MNKIVRILSLIFAVSIALFLFSPSLYAQPAKPYTPRIEMGKCQYKTSESLKTECGQLIVPENRQRPNGKTIKLPFVHVFSSAKVKKNDPVFVMVGGPGYPSVGSTEGIKEPMLDGRDYIALDQRGTKNTIPSLRCGEIEDAISRAYRENQPKEKLFLDAVKSCRKKLVAQGIDLSAYNTPESAADIEDLRKALKIESINLIGMSYSGDLMLTYLNKYPQHVRSVILDSPLPGYVSYDEAGLLNLNEALNKMFDYYEKDSGDKTPFGNLREDFKRHFASLEGKSFSMSYKDKKGNKTLNIKYGRNELLDIIYGKFSKGKSIEDIPKVVNDLIKGNHEPYISELFDGIFAGNEALSHGMRYSVYCSGQIAYANRSLTEKQNLLLPYLANYPSNDVSYQVCENWKVAPIAKQDKSPVYSNVPILLSAGDADPDCRSFYNDTIARYMPNSQRLLFLRRFHTPLLSEEGFGFVLKFLNEPMKKLKSENPEITVY